MRTYDIENVSLSRVLDDIGNVPHSVLLRINHLEQALSDLTFELNRMQKQIQRIQ